MRTYAHREFEGFPDELLRTGNNRLLYSFKRCPIYEMDHGFVFCVGKKIPLY